MENHVNDDIMNNVTEEREEKNDDKKKNNNWIWIIIIIILLLLLFRSCGEEETVKELVKIEDSSDWDGNSPTSGKNSKASSESFDVLSYQDIYLSEENKTVNLINPKGNTVYFKYTIKDKGGDVIESTSLIEPNKMVERDLYSKLHKGKHDLVFEIETFDIDTQEVCTGVDLNVRVYIE